MIVNHERAQVRSTRRTVKVKGFGRAQSGAALLAMGEGALTVSAVSSAVL